MPERLLVIEDEETVADILALNLEMEGFEVAKATNGTSGLAAALAGDFDLIICDVMMPDLDGYDICRTLKAERRTRSTPFILLTARAEVENKVAGLEAGADDFITKPFEFEDLLEHINMNLDRAARRYSSDKLTGFPSNIVADDALRETVLAGVPFAYLLISVNGLKPYRDAYGDEGFERAVRFTANAIRVVIEGSGRSGDLPACLGAGSFCVLTSIERAEESARDIIRLFDEGMAGFFSSEELDKGVFSTFDRQGNMVDNPLLTVSIGIASNAHRKIRSHWEAAELAREVLDHAMTFPVSKYVADRRTEGKKAQ